jgi:hypothetical protein
MVDQDDTMPPTPTQPTPTPPTDMPAPTPTQPEIARVAVRVPPFWPQHPKLWFMQLEAQFHTSGITEEKTKYNLIVGNLDAQTMTQVSDLLMNPSATTPYTALKHRLTEQFGETEQSRVRKLISQMDMGDQKPSDLWRTMKSLAGESPDTAFLKALWILRLPQNIQAVLAANDVDDTEKLASLADKINNTFVQPEVYAASTHTPSQEKPTKNARTLGDDRYAAMEKKIDELTQIVSKLRTTVRSQQRSRSRGPRDKSTPRSPSTTGMCYYHNRFGKKAHKCTEPCNFTSSENE